MPLESASSVATRAGDSGPGRRLSRLTERLRDLAVTVDAAVLEDEPQAAEMLAGFDRALPPEAVLVLDMCIPGYWLASYGRVALPRHLVYPMGWGTLGFGFPAAIGAALAGAGPTVCVSETAASCSAAVNSPRSSRSGSR